MLNARQMLLVNMMTDALPAAALAVSPQTGTAEVDRDEAAMWRAIGIRGASTTIGATLGWAMASVTGTPRRAATVGLIALVSTQLAQTLVDSHGPLVVATTVGSLGALVVVNTPGLSHVFGCTPVDPFGWGQALLAAAVATLASAVAPDLLVLLPRPCSDGSPAGRGPLLSGTQRRCRRTLFTFRTWCGNPWALGWRVRRDNRSVTRIPNEQVVEMEHESRLRLKPYRPRRSTLTAPGGRGRRTWSMNYRAW